jgi:hypothetical protein
MKTHKGRMRERNEDKESVSKRITREKENRERETKRK